MTKPTKWLVRPAKTQISLDIHLVWSESSLCTQWVAKDPSFHAESKDWSEWVDAQADQGLRWVHMSFCWFCHALAQYYKWTATSDYALRTCTPREDSHQLVHSWSLIRIFTGHILNCKVMQKFFHADKEESDQTVWMCRLIWVLVWCTSEGTLP